MSNFKKRLEKLAQNLNSASVTIRNVGDICPLYKEVLNESGYLVGPCQGYEKKGLGQCGAFKGQALEFNNHADFDKARKLKGVKCSYKG